MRNLVIQMAVAVIAVLASARTALADDPYQQTINLATVMHVATLPPPSGSGAGQGGIASPQLASFQSGGITPSANVIDAGQITYPPPPVLAAKNAGLDNGSNGAAGLELRTAPNPQVAVGPNHVIEVVDIVGRIYDKTTLAGIKNFELGDLFNVPTPRCDEGNPQPCWEQGQSHLVYDAQSDRFIASYTSRVNYPSGLDESRVHIAMSQTSDPTGYWDIWYSPKTEVYADEPWLGVTGDKVTISSNLFDIDDLSFVGQQTKTYDKSLMLAGLSVTETVYPVSPSFFAVRPAQHMTPGNDQVAASIYGNNLKVFRYTGAGLPTVTNVPVTGHNLPQVAFDPEGFIDTGDGRLLDAWVDGNNLWVTTHTTCEVYQSPGYLQRVCAQIIQVSLSTNTQVQGMTFGSFEDNYYPAARTDAYGNLVGVMSRSGAQMLVRAVAVTRGSGDPVNTLSTGLPLQTGEVLVTAGQAFPDPPVPWGAYFGAARDPSNSCVWVVGQYAKDVAGVSGGDDWGTVIGRMAHPSVADQCTDYDKDSLVDATDDEDDGDGFLDVEELGSPLCLNTRNDDAFEEDDYPRLNDGCPAVGAAETACTDLLDNDGDGAFNDGCPVYGSMGEGNWSIGTDPRARCGEGGATGSGPSVAWPADLISGGAPLDSTDKVNVLDLTSFLAPASRLNTKPGDANFDKRWDLDPGTTVGTNWLQIGDLTNLFAGSSGFPPMSGGAKVFGTSFVCTDPPPP